MTAGGTSTVDPDGRRKAWTHQGLFWAVAARRLVDSGQFVEIQLGLVATYVFVRHCERLVAGSVSVPADADAARSCPWSAEKLKEVGDYLADLRDQVLHFYDMDDPGRELGVSVTTDPVFEMTITRTVVRKSVKSKSVTRSELLGYLDELEPWLRDQFARLTS